MPKEEKIKEENKRSRNRRKTSPFVPQWSSKKLIKTTVDKSGIPEDFYSQIENEEEKKEAPIRTLPYQQI